MPTSIKSPPARARPTRKLSRRWTKSRVIVTLAEAGVQGTSATASRPWIPAFAGMTRKAHYSRRFSLHSRLRLSERQLAISVCRDRIAALAKGRMAAAVAHDPADLLPLNIAVDAGHPRVDLGEQQARA